MKRKILSRTTIHSLLCIYYKKYDDDHIHGLMHNLVNVLKIIKLIIYLSIFIFATENEKC
jgi:hypothetical protein